MEYIEKKCRNAIIHVRDIPTIRAGRQINFFNFWYAIYRTRKIEAWRNFH